MTTKKGGDTPDCPLSALTEAFTSR